MGLVVRKPVFRVRNLVRLEPACSGTEAVHDIHGWVERGRTGGPLKKNHKNIGFLSNTGPDLMKNHKATKPAFK